MQCIYETKTLESNPVRIFKTDSGALIVRVGDSQADITEEEAYRLAVVLNYEFPINKIVEELTK